MGLMLDGPQQKVQLVNKYLFVLQTISVALSHYCCVIAWKIWQAELRAIVLGVVMFTGIMF